MNTISRHIIEKPYLLIFFYLLLVYLVNLNFQNIAYSIILGIFFIEFLFRMFFKISIGKEYRYLFFTYSLIDHKSYGYSFRKNFKSKDLDFCVFDKFLFPSVVNPLNLSKEENKKNRLNFSINKLGFRGKEFCQKKINKNIIRIFCSGGSTTVGQSVSDRETWPFLLEKYLNKLGFETEVINAGVFGWSSINEFKRLKQEIINYEPDIVLLHQGWNEEFYFSSLKNGSSLINQKVRSRLSSNEIYTKDNKFNWLKNFMSIFIIFKFYRKKFIYNKKLKFSNVNRWEVLKNNEYLKFWTKNIIKFKRVSEKYKFALYLIDYPGLVHLSDSPKERKIYIQNTRLDELYADYQAISKYRISDLLNELNSKIKLLDVSDCFDNYKGLKRLKLFIDEIHYSFLGNKILAENIAKLLSIEMKNKLFLKKNIKKTSFNLNSFNFENKPFLNRLIDRGKIKALKFNYKSKVDIPSDRYTTF